MLELLYTKILKKLNLSNQQLDSLANQLTTHNICGGPFINGNKLCPNTKALDIKLNGQLIKNKAYIKNSLKSFGITSRELWQFYFLYDLPSIFSKRWQSRLLQKLKVSVNNLKQNA